MMVKMQRVGGAVLGLLLVTGCAGGATSGDSHGTHAASDAADTRTVAVEATDFAYAPQSLNAQVGQPITVLLHNEGSLEHDWTIEEIPAADVASEMAGASEAHQHGMDMAGAPAPSLHVAAMTKQVGRITFTPTKKGSYRYYCSVLGHAEAGMVGELVVQ